MKRWNGGTPAAASAALLIAVSIAGSLVPVSDADAQELRLIRVAANRSVSAVSLWGLDPFAKKYGLRAEVNATTTNADMQRAVQTGGVQIATLGYQSPAVMAEQKVSTVKIISGAYVGGQGIIMRKGVEVKSWKDLEGKRIGRPPGTYVTIQFTLAAQEFGLDLSKVNLINTTAAGVTELQALRNGDLDGMLHWSPVVDRAVVDGYAYYPECCDIGATRTYGNGNQVISANTEFLKDRTTALNFLKAYVEAKEFYTKNKDKAVALIAQYTGVTPTVLEQSLKRSGWDYRVDVEAAVNVAKQGPTFGFTRADMSGAVRDYIDLSLLSEVTGKPVAQLSTMR